MFYPEDIYNGERRFSYGMEHQYNFSNSPILPFGCRIMAHTSPTLQYKISDNDLVHYNVDSAPFHKAGIMLFDPKTKQTIVRRCFRQIDPTDETILDLPHSVLGTDSEESPDQSNPITTPTVSSTSDIKTKTIKQSPTLTGHIPNLLCSRQITISSCNSILSNQ